jgi:hypothetical protein
VLNRVFQSQNTTFGLSLVTDVRVFLAHTHHDTLLWYSKRQRLVGSIRSSWSSWRSIMRRFDSLASCLQGRELYGKDEQWRGCQQQGGRELGQVAKAEEILSYFSTKTYFCHS